MFFAGGLLPAQNYVTSLERWDVKNGLSHREVHAVLKGRAGYLWIATANGLNRFDGYNFITYNSDNAGLPFNNIIHMAQDASGRLWLLGTPGPNNLCLFNPATGRAELLLHPFSQGIDFVDATTDGRIVFGSENPAQFFLYDVRAGTARINVPAVPPYDILAVTEHNTIWILKKGREFYEYDLRGQLTDTWQIPIAGATYKSNYLPRLGMYALNYNAGKTYHISPDKKVTDVTAVAPDHDPLKLDYMINTGVDGIIWRQGKLYHPKYGMLRDFALEGVDDLSGGVRDCISPRRGEVWLAGSFGLYKVTIGKSRFKRYLYDNKPAQDHHNSFRNILVDGDRLYASSEYFGVLTQGLDDTGKGKMFFSGYAHNDSRFYALARAANGNLFFSSHGRIYKSDKKGNAGLFTTIGKAECWSIYSYAADTLLLGLDKGLGWAVKGKETFIPYSRYGNCPSLANTLVHQIQPFNDQLLLICAADGLYVFEREKGIIAKYALTAHGKYHLPANNFYQSVQDKDGTYWLGTDKGLLHWDIARNQYRLYTATDGLGNTTIYAAYPDDNGRIWMSSDYGVMSLDKGSGVVNTYLTEDGITNNEFNRISHFRDKNGSLYFGSLNGITAFNPAEFPAEAQDIDRSPLAITSFKQLDGKKNKLVDRTDELLHNYTVTLSATKGFFALELSLLNFSDPEHTTYYWKIDGIDKVWNAQRDRTLRFTSLPYGKYNLHLKAKAAEGVWSANELIIHLNVPAPLYRRPWFALLLIAGLAILTSTFFYRHSRKLAKDKEKLETTVQQRTAELKQLLEQKDTLMKEIHHRVKNNLQVISALQQMQSNRSKDPNVKAALEESQNRVLSIAFIHHNLYLRDDVSGVEMKSFVAELQAHIASVFKLEDAEVTVRQNIEEITLDIDTAVPLGMIINELFTNAYKYAFKGKPVGQIEISISSMNEGMYELRFADNGAGLPGNINPSTSSTLGLKLINMLSRQIGGIMNYTYNEGAQFNLLFKDFETRNK